MSIYNLLGCIIRWRDTIKPVTDTGLVAQQTTVWRQIKNLCRYAARVRPRTAAVWISPERWVFPDDRRRRRSTPPRARTTTTGLDSREEFFDGGGKPVVFVCVVHDCRRRGLLGDRRAATAATTFHRALETSISSSTRTHEHIYNEHTDIFYFL